MMSIIHDLQKNRRCLADYLYMNIDQKIDLDLRSRFYYVIDYNDRDIIEVLYLIFNEESRLSHLTIVCRLRSSIRSIVCNRFVWRVQDSYDIFMITCNHFLILSIDRSLSLSESKKYLERWFYYTILIHHSASWFLSYIRFFEIEDENFIYLFDRRFLFLYLIWYDSISNLNFFVTNLNIHFCRSFFNNFSYWRWKHW